MLIKPGNLIAPGLYPSEMTQGAMKSLEKDVDNGHGAFVGAHKMAPDASPAGQCRSCVVLHQSLLYLYSECRSRNSS